jgi:hypothetical protein
MICKREQLPVEQTKIAKSSAQEKKRKLRKCQTEHY